MTTTKAEPTAPAVQYAMASEIGGRTRQEDAATMRTHRADWGGYVIAAIADGVGSVPGTHVIADAAVHAVCALGEAADYQWDPEQLITLAAGVVPLHARYANNRDGRIFDQFEARAELFDPSPDTTVAVATIGPDGAISVGWLGDCRVHVRLVRGDVLALTEDHNMGKFDLPHVLTRSLAHPGDGPQGGSWTPDSNNPGNQPVDVVLTTDGVHDVLPHTAIRCALENAPNPQRAAHWMTRWAVRAAGERADNATAVVLRVKKPTSR
ncbi:PP2C family protein-serine/threonine phosphatase [Nocardia carnea]|uniref:PP2C family protein-serine/threonine phosphatase n=1 Tax=Nocardia carnea TaxID=37328 RepID=UPI0024557C80|nr:protein phosphatase 2C domain-containing protein [Nocardia carnea]